MQRARGFTLLEILVVIVLMAVMAGLVAPSFGDFRQADLEDEARRLARALQLAADEAALSGEPLRLVLQPDGYGFERHGKDRKWVAIRQGVYRFHALAKGIRLELPDAQLAGAKAPWHFVIMPVAGGGQLDLRLQSGEKQRRVVHLMPGALAWRVKLEAADGQ